MKKNLVLAWVFVFALFVCAVPAFAQKMQKKPQKWWLCMEPSKHPSDRGDSYQLTGLNFKLIKNVGAWNDSIELLNGKKVAFNQNIALKDIKSIKTIGAQYIEFVSWYGKYEWDTIKATRGSYWRLEPNSELVFDRSPSGVVIMYPTSGGVSKDVNYVTVGEAVEFAELVVDSLDFNKIKSEFKNLKKKFEDYNGNKNLCPVVGINCACKGDLQKHLIIQGGANAGWLGAVSGVLPTAVALPAEYFAQMAQYRMNAKLAYLTALAYGWDPTKQQFQLQMFELFSGMNVSKSDFLNGMAGTVRDEMIEKAAEAIAKKVGAKFVVGAIPVAGPILGALTGGAINRSQAMKFAEAAKEKYKR